MYEKITQQLRLKLCLNVKVLFCLLLAFVLPATKMQAQFIIDTTQAPGNFVANNGNGWTTFNFTNTNAFDVMITDVSAVTTAAYTNAEAYLYTSTTAVNGAPGIISTASVLPWVQRANQTINTVSGNTVPQPILTGLSVIIPANT